VIRPIRLTVGALAVTMASTMTSACVPQGLSFRVDERVKILSPKDRAEVSLPITLAWSVHDFDVKSSPTGTGGSFAVFVDEAPVPPGKTLAWVARNDSDCAQVPSCPDAAYLAKRGIYATTDTTLVLRSLPGSSASSSSSKRDRHRAVIVLLDADGRRISEIAYAVTFDLKREG
jgi:hypothetical protein